MKLFNGRFGYRRHVGLIGEVIFELKQLKPDEYGTVYYHVEVHIPDLTAGKYFVAHSRTPEGALAHALADLSAALTEGAP